MVRAPAAGHDAGAETEIGALRHLRQVPKKARCPYSVSDA